MSKSKKELSDVSGFANTIEAICVQDGVSHGELARRLEMKKPRIPTFLKCQNMTEQLFGRCLAALGYKLTVEWLGVEIPSHAQAAPKAAKKAKPAKASGKGKKRGARAKKAKVAA